jgi:hypothetical protein
LKRRSNADRRHVLLLPTWIFAASLVNIVRPQQPDPKLEAPANNLMEDFMTRRPFNHTLPPTDRIIVEKWARGVAAFYASIALLALIGVAVAHHRGDGAQNQFVLRPLQMN